MNDRDRFLAAARCQPVDRPPVWLMRQAGRYLPEYQELRGSHDFLTMCRTPDLAREVTLQPLRRYDMDAAIIFSDILVIPEAMGQSLSYPPGGPRLKPAVQDAAGLAALKKVNAAEDLDYVAEALRRTRESLGTDKALLGFAGAPYTLATYMVEGAGSKHQAETKKLAFAEPALLDDLIEMLTDAVIDFLRLQIEAGADAVQLFDTWAGDLAPAQFEHLALKPARRIFAALQDLGVPLIYFVNGIGPHFHEALDVGAQVFALDWRLDLAACARQLPKDVAVQGNMDPLMLTAPPETIAQYVREQHASLEGRPGHIFNLGHGILPFIPVEGVGAFVKAVQDLGGASD